MKTFDELWDFIKIRPGVTTVQDRTELEYIYNLMKECEPESYLEVGTAEGNSLYVLGSAIKKNGTIRYIDYGEKHTAHPQHRIVTELQNLEINVIGRLGDSTNPNTYFFKNSINHEAYMKHDVVMIDGGHDYTTVLSDAIMYAPLAKKYIFFHDIQLPEVKAAVDWFVRRGDLGEYHEFINSTHYGYGIIKVRSC